MKNKLKRIFSLVLAMATLMTVCVFGASAPDDCLEILFCVNGKNYDILISSDNPSSFFGRPEGDVWKFYNYDTLTCTIPSNYVLTYDESNVMSDGSIKNGRSDLAYDAFPDKSNLKVWFGPAYVETSVTSTMPEFYSSLGDVPCVPDCVTCYFVNSYDGSPAVISRGADYDPWKIVKYDGHWRYYMLGQGNDAFCSDTCVYTTDPSKVTSDGKIIDGLSDDIMEFDLGDYFFFGEPYEESTKAVMITGDAIPNATSYVLYSKTESGYTELATSSTLSFNLTSLNLADGDYIFVVKAKADGYDDSEYSNEVTWTNEVYYTVTNGIVNGTLAATETGGVVDKARHGRTFTAKIVPDAGCALPDSVVVKKGEQVLSSGYTYNAQTGVVTVENVTGAISIIASMITKPDATVLTLGGEENNQYPNGGVVSWTLVSGATGYKGYIGSECIFTVGADVMTYDLRMLSKAAGTYSVTVKAVNKAGEGTVSNAVSFVSVSVQKLTKPVLTNSSTASQCIFSFAKDANAGSYAVYANGTLISASAYQMELKDGVYTVTIPDTYFTKGQTVEITVKAIATSGTAFLDSDSSAVMSFSKTKDKLATPVIQIS